MRFKPHCNATLATVVLFLAPCLANAAKVQMWALRETTVCARPPDGSWKMSNPCRTVPRATSYDVDIDRGVQSTEGLRYPLWGNNSSWIIPEDWGESEEQLAETAATQSEPSTASTSDLEQTPEAYAVYQNLMMAISVGLSQVTPETEQQMSSLIVMLEQTDEDISGYPAVQNSWAARSILADIQSTSFCDRVQIDAFDPVAYKLKIGLDLFGLIANTQLHPSAQRQANGQPILHQELIALYRQQRAALACLGE